MLQHRHCPAARRNASAYSTRRNTPVRRTPHQHGAIAITLALMLLAILCFCGMAVDISQLTNRKTELQGIANAVALSAARELDGTAAGVAKALSSAASTANAWHYQYNTQTAAWNNAAIAFSISKDGAWLDAAAAKSTPAGLLYAKVNTSELDASHGSVSLALLQLLTGGADSADMAASAIAGRTTINITPFAICAMSALPASVRANPPATLELVEFGFRRGVSYDLMQLNPAGTTSENFAVDPFAIPGTAGSASGTTPSTLEPFVCGGVLAMPRVMGGQITVSRPFPLGSLYSQFNSRFDQYAGGGCTPDGAPPDTNIKAYPYTSITWMGTVPGGQGAQASTDSGKLWTVADPLPAPASNTAPMYGPLWAYARAVPFSSYSPGASEPAGGYTPFAISAWATLYKPGSPTASASYPGGTSVPYRAISGANFQAPSTAHLPGLANRRVLNVPLLSCPVGGTAATVIGIGKFFMTVPATASTLVAEFAGTAPELSVGGQVELVR